MKRKKKTKYIYKKDFTKNITEKYDLNKGQTIITHELITKTTNEANNVENKIEEEKDIDPNSFSKRNKEYDFDIIRKSFEEKKNSPTAY